MASPRSLSPNTSPATSPTRNPNRPPPPSLFLGPPNTNASNLSLPPTSPSTRAPLLRARSTLAANQDLTAKPAPLGRTRTSQPVPAQSEGDRTDALWAEMQATLAEVETSALSSTHVFGAAHSAALEELREAQIGLAVAWGRGEADEKEEGISVGTTDKQEGGDRAGGEEDEEADILEARRRREANERFFKKVGEGVVDVVDKLEAVAAAMAKVEKESREMWTGSESLDSTSVAS